MTLNFTNEKLENGEIGRFSIEFTAKALKKAPITNLKFAIEGNYFMTCSEPSLFQLWNSESKALIQEFKPVHNAVVNDFQIFEGNKKIVSGDETGNVSLWNVLTQQIEQQLFGNSFVD